MQQLTASSSLVDILEIQSSEFYEAAIIADETIASNYWYLGISYLLTGREEDAQAAWFVPISDADPTEIDSLTTELLTVLAQAADIQAKAANFEQAFLIRQHFWLLAPDRLDNVLELVVLVHKLNRLTSELLFEWQVSELLELATVGEIRDELIERVLTAMVDHHTELSVRIIELCLELIAFDREVIISKTVTTAFKLFHQDHIMPFAVKVVESCNRIQPDTANTLNVLTEFYLTIQSYQEAIAVSERYYQLATNTVERLIGSFMVQKTYFTAGNYDNVRSFIATHHHALVEFIQSSPQNLNYAKNQHCLTCAFFLPYIEDNPHSTRTLQNQIAIVHQQNILVKNVEIESAELTIKKKTGCLRIGYIGSTLKKHSVGWLSRWLIHHHDRDSFQIFVYNISVSREDRFSHQWFRDKVDVTYYCETKPHEIIAQIKADEIDILIDLDSLTYDTTYFIMACKPAPVQLTWLGWDASGIPTIDYFIADPYVLPSDAQEYYQEKIWRLPQTYLAVDGFEVGIPTLRREDLDIPADAVIYLSSQTGYKRHPDSIRCQMQIIKTVPNSYFLVKGKSDPETIRNFFGKLAAEVGISLDRLRFLAQSDDEPTHRANLAIADVVLDTFPYNGATTTLETLWMGIPMVTQVGQQFAARNSYTFMLNAGIEEGIAWNEQEYIEWGIKLGLDRELRNKIAGKLRSGQTTAPVWNAKKFTLEMEDAYRQMWEIYQNQHTGELIEKYLTN